MPRRLLRDGEVVADEWRTSSEAAGDDLAADSHLMLTLRSNGCRDRDAMDYRAAGASA